MLKIIKTISLFILFTCSTLTVAHAGSVKTISCNPHSPHTKPSAFCEADMYFTCGKSTDAFKATLHLETLGAGNHMSQDDVYEGSGRLEYRPELWVTEADGSQFFTKKEGFLHTFRRNTNYLVKGENGDWLKSHTIKAGDKLWFEPTMNYRVPNPLSGHIETRNKSTSVIRSGGIFQMGPGDTVKYNTKINYFTFYARPKSNSYQLFWARSESLSKSKLTVHKVKCKRAKLKN